MKQLILLALCLCFTQAEAVTKRSQSAKAHFAKLHPCPATGKPVASCTGYVIDHIVPLCAGGKDAPENMQWQTTADSYVKDAQERKTCKQLKK